MVRESMPIEQLYPETAEIFGRAIQGRNGHPRCCHTVIVLVQRAMILPGIEKECIQFIIKTAKMCGVKRVVCVLTRFGLKHPNSKDLCQEFIIEVCNASA